MKKDMINKIKGMKKYYDCSMNNLKEKAGISIYNKAIDDVVKIITPVKITHLTIGVITPTDKQFKQWVREEGCIKYRSATFILIRNANTTMIRGYAFDAVEQGYDYHLISCDVVKQALLRVKPKK